MHGYQLMIRLSALLTRIHGIDQVVRLLKLVMHVKNSILNRVLRRDSMKKYCVDA